MTKFYLAKNLKLKLINISFLRQNLLGGLEVPLQMR